MKLKYIIPVIIGLSLVSCHKDLDIPQNSQLASKDMWKDEADAVAAVRGAHSLMRAAFSQGLVYWGEYRTGLWGPGNHGGLTQAERDQVYQSTMNSTHTRADWEQLYKTINMANLILKYTPQIEFVSAATQNEMMANAYFIRANCYYWIARIWGDAPLVLEGTESPTQNLFPSRAPVAQVLAQVESDIQAGIDAMPANITNRKQASPASLNMLKADYSLWMYKVRNAGQNYLTAAETAVNAVKSYGHLALSTSYANIFDVATESGTEIIYAWNYQQEEYTGGYPGDYQFNSATVTAAYHFNPVVVGTGQQWTFYTNAYGNILKEVPTDTRLLTNYQTFHDPQMNQTFNFTNKYKGSWINNTLILDADIILYRLADAYMFDAEIKLYNNDIPGAMQAVNLMVKRAYGVDNYYDLSQTPANAKAIIIKERLKEFPAEGKLWWDLIRLDAVFDYNTHLAAKQEQPNILLWPLSNNSINDNPNLGGQTPGWN